MRTKYDNIEIKTNEIITIDLKEEIEPKIEGIYFKDEDDVMIIDDECDVPDKDSNIYIGNSSLELIDSVSINNAKEQKALPEDVNHQQVPVHSENIHQETLSLINDNKNANNQINSKDVGKVKLERELNKMDTNADKSKISADKEQIPSILTDGQNFQPNETNLKEQSLVQMSVSTPANVNRFQNIFAFVPLTPIQVDTSTLQVVENFSFRPSREDPESDVNFLQNNMPQQQVLGLPINQLNAAAGRSNQPLNFNNSYYEQTTNEQQNSFPANCPCQSYSYHSVPSELNRANLNSTQQNSNFLSSTNRIDPRLYYVNRNSNQKTSKQLNSNQNNLLKSNEANRNQLVLNPNQSYSCTTSQNRAIYSQTNHNQVLQSKANSNQLYCNQQIYQTQLDCNQPNSFPEITARQIPSCSHTSNLTNPNCNSQLSQDHIPTISIPEGTPLSSLPVVSFFNDDNQLSSLYHVSPTYPDNSQSVTKKTSVANKGTLVDVPPKRKVGRPRKIKPCENSQGTRQKSASTAVGNTSLLKKMIQDNKIQLIPLKKNTGKSSLTGSVAPGKCCAKIG